MSSELTADELVRAPRVVFPCSMLEPRMLTASRGLPRKTSVSSSAEESIDQRSLIIVITLDYALGRENTGCH